MMSAPGWVKIIPCSGFSGPYRIAGKESGTGVPFRT